MSDKIKLVLVVAIFLAAGVVYLVMNGPFHETPGAGKRMEVDCAACRYHGEIMLDIAMRSGATFSGETGWAMACPKCGKPASVHAPLVKPTLEGESKAMASMTQEGK